LIVGHGFHTRGDHDCAADEGATEIVVEFADAFDYGHGCVGGHGLVS